MQPGAMKRNENGADGDVVHNDPDLAAFLKQLVTGEEGEENNDKVLGMNMWDALDGDDIASDGMLDGVLGRTGQSKDDKGISSAHDIFLDGETEKALVRAGGKRARGGFHTPDAGGKTREKFLPPRL